MTTIWIDLENSPHVLFFKPIIRRLRERGYQVEITARDFAQTLALLDNERMDYTAIGGLYGKNVVSKVAGTLMRGWRLARLFWRKDSRPAVSAGHCSRGHLIAAALLRIPALTSYDYEFVDTSLPNRLATRVYLPGVVGDEDVSAAGINTRNLFRYDGLKEELYIRDFQPQPDFRATLGFDNDRVLAVFRPPSTTSHYHNQHAERLMEALLKRFVAHPEVALVLLPRYPEQKEEMRRYFAEHQREVMIPETALDGLNLIWHADLVVSGGGTMIREAAVLGVPAYTIFQGRRGAVDRHLSHIGRLNFLDSVEDVSAISFTAKTKNKHEVDKNHLAEFFVQEIIDMIDKSKHRGPLDANPFR